MSLSAFTSEVAAARHKDGCQPLETTMPDGAHNCWKALRRMYEPAQELRPLKLLKHEKIRAFSHANMDSRPHGSCLTWLHLLIGLLIHVKSRLSASQT